MFEQIYLDRTVHVHHRKIRDTIESCLSEHTLKTKWPHFKNHKMKEIATVYWESVKLMIFNTGWPLAVLLLQDMIEKQFRKATLVELIRDHNLHSLVQGYNWAKMFLGVFFICFSAWRHSVSMQITPHLHNLCNKLNKINTKWTKYPNQ